MKIGIITFHFAHNQGAVLQCYALQQVLDEMGHEVKVINYCPKYHTMRYQAKRDPFFMAYLSWKNTRKSSLPVRFYNSARSFAKGIYVNLKNTYQLREQNFSHFANEYLNLSEMYKTIKSLRNNPPAYDAYVSGSDQLWNTDLVDGTFDPAYFLDFGGKDIRKITYAVSLKESYTEKEKQSMKQLCKNLDAVSIREESEIATDVLNGEYTVCIDPTLLLGAEKYEEATSKTAEKKPYIFVYGFQNTKGLHEAVSIISKELGVRVINGSPERIKLAEAEKSYNYGPDMFLSYIKNAEYVITNSFHGTAFSLIFKKNFVTVAHTTRGKRMTELLSKLGLAGRIWNGPACNWKEEIDYADVDKKREELREQAIDYLKKNLSIEK